nr:AraC family transcriptional regulator [Paenibacillus pasadenensis]
MVNGDILQQKHPKKAAKAPIHHSVGVDHFHGDFPLYMNRWKEGFELREHDHDFFEIAYVMAGEGYHYVGESVEKTGKGLLYLLPVGTPHLFRPSSTADNHRLIVYNLCIRTDFLGGLNHWLKGYGDDGEALSLFDGVPGSFAAVMDRTMELGPIFAAMLKEFEEQRLGYRTNMLAMLMELAVRITRLQQETEPPMADYASAGRNSRAVMAAMLDYIDRHAPEPLTAEQLAQQAGISRRHFIRLFQQAAGMGFSDYVQLRRIEHACRMLAGTDHKVAYIAKSSGYRDTAHFREVFRKLIGMSPSEYRKGAARTGPHA